jgi:hypothetical protein
VTDRVVPLHDVELAVEAIADGLNEQGALDGELDVLRRWVVEQLHWWLDHPADLARARERYERPL